MGVLRFPLFRLWRKYTGPLKSTDELIVEVSFWILEVIAPLGFRVGWATGAAFCVLFLQIVVRVEITDRMLHC